MAKICLVTGANGHLGNNLVRALLDRGKNVRSSVRNVNYAEPFEGLDCEVVYADLLDRESLSKAMKDVETLYQVAAVFKHWAKNLQKEIIGVNLEGTKNVLEVAAEQGVKRIVYVSSMAALDHTSVPMEETTWNSDFPNAYYQSKTESEKLAWNLAEKLDLWLVSVLPSGMIGPNCFGHLTPTMDVLNAIVKNKLPIDINFHFNYVDVRDVANSMIAAAEKGRSGERYILGNEISITTTEIIKLAQSLFPGVKKPARRSKNLVMALAFLMEFSSKITGKAPNMTRSLVKTYYGADQRVSISKARRELGYNPRSPEDALKEALIYLAGKDDQDL